MPDLIQTFTARGDLAHPALLMWAPASGNGTVNAQFKNRFDIVRLGVNDRF